MTRVAILFDNFGPYHRARLAAAAQVCELLALEVAHRSGDYSWEAEPAGGFHSECLFKGTSAELASSVIAARLNEVLEQAEQALLLPDGLPGREWYRHSIYAPGLYTGYGAKTIPGVREAAEAQRWDEANRETKRVATALRAITGQIEEATKLLRQ